MGGAGGMGGEGGMGGMPVDVDFATGPLAEPPFPRGQVLGLAGEGGGYVIWIRDGQLWAAARDGAGGLAEATLIAEGVTAPRMLQGARLGDQWWVVVPEAADEDGAYDLVAYNVAAEAGAAEGRVELGIRADGEIPNYAIAQREDEALIIGRGIPRDIGEEVDGAPLNLRQMTAEGRGFLISDGAGLPFPESVTPALEGWVMAAQGHCAWWSPEASFLGRWRCPTLVAGGLVAEGERLTLLGALADPMDPLAVRGQMQGATPGVDPLTAPTFDLPGVPDTGHGVLQRVGDDQRDLAIIQGLDAGEGEEISLLIASAEGVRRAYLPNAESPPVMGALIGGGRRDLILWQDDAPALMPIDAEATVETPTYSRPDAACAQAVVAPEDCSEVDRDCDGDPRNGLCCAETQPLVEGAFSKRLRVGQEGLPTPTALSPDGGGLLFAIDVVPTPLDARRNDVIMGQTDLASGETEILGTFSLMHDPSMFRVTEGAVVLTALREDTDLPALLWSLPDGEGGWAVSESDAPCDPILEMEIIEGDRVRLYCPDAMRQVPFGGGNFADVEVVRYPDNIRDVRWVRRRSYPGPVEGGSEELLVAVGVDYDLAHWRSDLSGASLAVEPELPHEELDLLSMDFFDREVPVYGPAVPGGYMVRRTRRRWLEVFVPGYGWSPVPGSTWPLEAQASPDLPYAVQSAYLGRRREADLRQLPVSFFLHDLRPGGAWWGTPLTFEGDQVAAINHRAFGLTPFEIDDPQALPRLVLLRDSDAGVGYVTGVSLSCE